MWSSPNVQFCILYLSTRWTAAPTFTDNTDKWDELEESITAVNSDQIHNGISNLQKLIIVIREIITNSRIQYQCV